MKQLESAGCVASGKLRGFATFVIMAGSKENGADFSAPPMMSMGVEHLCDVILPFYPRVFETPLGTRQVIVTNEGQVIGRQLRGELQAFSSIGLFTKDGVATGSGSCVMHTEDGADILAWVRGKVPPTVEEPLQTMYRAKNRTWLNSWGSASFETGDERYLWLNSAISILQVGFSGSEAFLRFYLIT
ncbi:MAG: DUF3237 family protein [Corynebacteriales bacterium]|nr:DUF3237 family protein [Mycobacteriales bacterium]